jgi:hypothetical protein
MDRDNVRLALGLEKLPMSLVPTHAKGTINKVMPVLWSDSILFQKFQHFAHGDISINDYLDYIKRRIDNNEVIFPIYCNDAEVFDYRPGRFSEERVTHIEGEWNRIVKLLKTIDSKSEIEFISPKKALEISSKVNNKIESKLVSTAYPITVKKQAKYNIARWAISGRNDFWLNTMCYRIERYLIKSKNNNHSDWRELCELWSSDLRSHITDKKWKKANNQLNLLLKRNEINSTINSKYQIGRNYEKLENVIGEYGGSQISLEEENILLCISTKNIMLKLNLRRGLAISSLAFSSHKMEPCIGTLPHGHFSSISLGADFYSGGLLVELPLQRKRVTDLEKVEPKFLINDDGNIEINSEIKTQFGNIIKVIEVSVKDEKVSLSYSFSNWEKFIGSVRLGVVTLLNQFSNKNTKIKCSNGGENNEIFDFNGEFNHTKSASTLVSSSRGLAATSGRIQIQNEGKSLSLQWNPCEGAVMPMLHNTSFNDRTLSRVIFSMKEVDDTVKYPSNIENFSFSIVSEQSI